MLNDISRGVKKDQMWLIIQIFLNKKIEILLFKKNTMIKYLFQKIFKFRAKYSYKLNVFDENSAGRKRHPDPLTKLLIRAI